MKRTRIYPFHKQHSSRFIDFFGWEMPVEYSGIIKEHLAVRNQAGLFDVSHMGEIIISGKQALDLVQYLTPNDAARLTLHKAQYSALTTPKGTFVDDMLVYCLDSDRYMLVVNAANSDKDYEWILHHAQGFDAMVTNRSDDYTQVALQGPHSVRILQPVTEISIQEMRPFGVEFGRVGDEEAIVSRTGYTGEDGFEVYTLSERPDKIWDALLEGGKDQGIIPVGLGARDTLRLEARLMLYGNDIDETTTVLEADLGWLIKFKKGDFLGRDALLKQREEGIRRKIVGFEILGKEIARPHYPVFVEGNKVSEVNSGSFSPIFQKSIGLTYLPIEHSELGMEFAIGVRGKKVPARVVSTPFYTRSEPKD